MEVFDNTAERLLDSVLPS